MYKEVVHFIQNIYNTTDFIPLHAPKFLGNEKKYILDSIDSTFVSSIGEYVNRFEIEFAKKINCKYAVATVNGTSALHVSLILVGVKKETEVLTQPLTFIATCNAISYIGAFPHFIDVDKDTMGLSPTILRKHLEEIAIVKDGVCYNKETNRVISACVPMHTFGHACKIDEIVAICNEYHIPVVEDAAEALGSYYKSKHLGTFGKVAAFSFNGNKIITSGGGGVIVTDDKEIAERAKHLTTTAKVSHPYEYVHNAIGYNYRMPNLNAALLLAQLEQLDLFVENKRALANLYSNFFKNKLIEFKIENDNCISNYWLNVLLFNTIKDRNQFINFMNDNDVMVRPIWQLMNHMVMFKDCPASDLTNSEWLEKRVVNIPSSITI
tara:strand:- start:3436 stop:4575 length:1140 start_codon:yes stop_codon:yes gene_type:complete